MGIHQELAQAAVADKQNVKYYVFAGAGLTIAAQELHLHH